MVLRNVSSTRVRRRQVPVHDILQKSIQYLKYVNWYFSSESHVTSNVIICKFGNYHSNLLSPVLQELRLALDSQEIL
jgi:hypothetical protein